MRRSCSTDTALPRSAFTRCDDRPLTVQRQLDRRKGATEQGTAPTSPVPPSHPEADRLALPVTQDARAEHSLDVSHPSMIVPHGATDAVEAERKKPHAFDHAVRPHSVEEFVWAMISAWGLAGWWGSDANQTVVRKRRSELVRSVATC